MIPCTYSIFRAQPINGKVPPRVHINITETLPTRVYGCDHYAIFGAQAKILADALEEALPGGTLDALLRELLLRRASQLIVPQPPSKA